jgi:hypothetical protein
MKIIENRKRNEYLRRSKPQLDRWLTAQCEMLHEQDGGNKVVRVGLALGVVGQVVVLLEDERHTLPHSEETIVVSNLCSWLHRHFNRVGAEVQSHSGSDR